MCKRYDNILLPSFESKNIAQKIKHKETNRHLLKYAHYSFKQKLKWVGKKLDCKIIDVTEEYTSKTCGNCGHIDNKLKNKKIYDCKKCKKGKVDRDLNGSRNILIKYLKSL